MTEDLADDPASWSLRYGRDSRPAGDLLLRAEQRLADDAADAEGWTLLARAAQLRGKTQFARAALEKALAGGAADPGLRAYLARICCDLGDAAAGAAWLERAPGVDGASFAAGVAALGEGRPQAALEAFRAEAARRGPSFVAADWSANYLAAALSRSPAPPGDASLLAILDYKSPDLAWCSSNLGDYIQTAAVLRQLARLSRVRLAASDPAAPRMIGALAARVRVDELITSPGALQIEVLDRDMPWPAADRFAGQTLWTLCYGWHFHRAFRCRSPLPAPDNVEPIVFSFHLATPQLLQPAVTDWLRRFAPIGCRDWTTVGWLLNQDVDAFFTGCVTSTWPAAAPSSAPRRGVIAVDVPIDEAPAGAARVTHEEQGLRAASLEDAIRRGLDRLDLYAGASEVVTSRLHCYLPCRALRTPVELRGPSAVDVRFDGLAGISDAALDEMATNLSRWIGGAVAQIAAGQSTSEIRRSWREATEEAVAQARARLGIATSPAPRGKRSPAGPAAARADVVDIAMPADGPRRRQALTALRSIVANTAAALRFRPQAAGEGRAALAERLDDVGRLVYLAGPIVVAGDLAELAAHDPGPSGIAARTDPDPRSATLGLIVERHAATLDADRARRLRALAAARVDLTAPAFDADVCVFDPATLRRLATARACETWMGEFGVDDALALNLFAGGAFAELPAEWNHHPYGGLIADPRLVHWAEPPYPWLAARKVLLAERWREYENPDGPWSVIDDISLDLAAPFRRRAGFGWTVRLPPSAGETGGRNWTLREDARPLPPTRATVDDICALGGGRHLIGARAVWFSASDNSDPNLNGRRYRLTAWSAAEGPVGARSGVSGEAGAG